MRAQLVADLLVDSRATGLKMCIVFGEGDTVYCNPDGTSYDSVSCSSGGVRLDEVRVIKGYGPS